MAYNINFPQPLDFLRDSQPLMLGNFQEIPIFISQDHYTFADPDQGKHRQLTMTQQDATMIINTNANDWILFQALSALSGINQLYSKDSTNALLDFSDAHVDVNDQVNWVSLPSGLIIKWAEVDVDFDLDSGDNGQKNYTFTWPILPGDKPFTAQFWAIVLPNDTSDTSAPFSIKSSAYVNKVSDPTKVEWNLWFTSRFHNNILFPLPNFESVVTCTILAIGV